jgi:putative addiction module component (TIGR02574 family)
MNTTDQLEADILRLPPHERERLALVVWESLENDDAWLSDPGTDREGIAVAHARDDEIESGQVEPLTHEEFLRRIRGASE